MLFWVGQQSAPAPIPIPGYRRKDAGRTHFGIRTWNQCPGRPARADQWSHHGTGQPGMARQRVMIHGRERATTIICLVASWSRRARTFVRRNHGVKRTHTLRRGKSGNRTGWCVARRCDTASIDVHTTLALLDRSADSFFVFRAARLCSPARLERQKARDKSIRRSGTNGMRAYRSIHRPDRAAKTTRPALHLGAFILWCCTTLACSLKKISTLFLNYCHHWFLSYIELFGIFKILI
jgi:hypothetical protein